MLVYDRIAGDLQANIKPGSTELPHIPQQSLFSRFSSLLTSTVSPVRTEKKKNTDLSIPNTTPLQRFVRTIALIEKERLNIRHNLMVSILKPGYYTGFYAIKYIKLYWVLWYILYNIVI